MVRHLTRDRRIMRGGVLRAPWRDAAPVALVITAVLCVGLLVADAGGWSQLASEQVTWTTYAPLSGDEFGASSPPIIGDDRLLFHGGQLFVALGGLLVLFALAGWRWASLLSVAGLGVALAGWVQDFSRLDYLTVVFREAPTQREFEQQIETSITMYGVVWLLLAVAGLTALTWAIAGVRERRRLARPERKALRRPWRQSIGIGVGATLVALALPRIGKWLARATATPSALNDPFPISQGAHTMYVLFLAIVVIYACSVALPRRAPIAATAFTIVGAALWIPTGWMFGGIALDQLPVPYGGATTLAFWVFQIAAAAGIAAWAVGRAGRGHPAQTAP